MHRSRTPHRRTVQLVAGALGAGTLALVPTAAFGAGSGTGRTVTGTPGAAGTPGTQAPGARGGGTGQASNPVCSQTQFQAAQQKVETGLSDRVTQLDKLLARVQAAKHLTSSDQSTLENDISNTELPGIQALQPEVQAATTCKELWGYAHAMVYDFRVYVVMTPQTDQTIAADTETYVDQKLSGLEPKVQAAIAKAQSEGKDVSGAEAAFADMQNQVSSAAADVNGLSATLLAQTPSGYPGNESVFKNARSAEESARTALKAAAADLKQIRTDLRGGSSTGSNPAATSSTA